MRYWRPLPERGVAVAQCNVGMMYAKGLGVPQDTVGPPRGTRRPPIGKRRRTGQPRQDVRRRPRRAGGYAQALIWYRKAAEQGEAFAQHNLALMYQNGLGVPQDYAQALIWYRKAANRGVAAAQHNLGWMYQNGQGVPRTMRRPPCGTERPQPGGRRRAAQSGVMYGKGQGVPQDYRRPPCGTKRPLCKGTSTPSETSPEVAYNQTLAFLHASSI